MGSVVVAGGLSRYAVCAILFPWLGIELLSPALQGGFLTTGPPGKSPKARTFILSYYHWRVSFSSVQFSCSVTSNSLQPHGLQHARLPCSSPTPRVYLDSCPWSQWCHPTISSSVVPFSSCLQSFPPSGSFPMSQFFTSGGQSIGSFSFSISPSNEYSRLISFRIDLLELLAVQGTLKSSPIPQFKSINSSVLSFLYSLALTPIHDLWKHHSFD